LPETNEENQKRLLRELEAKNVQHYSVLLSAWIQTRMERDKTLVALSAAAVGLLVTILTAVGLRRLWMAVLYAGAFTGFLITIWVGIRIYQLNSDKLEHELRGADSTTYKQIDLRPYDRWSTASFLIGAVFAIIIGVTSAIISFRDRQEGHMATTGSQQANAPEERSLQGIENLRPEAPPSPQTNAPRPDPSKPAGAPVEPGTSTDKK
jgi:hypothetical protein